MNPIYFGIRHLSPAGAVCLQRILDEIQPQLILIEGPSDLNRHMSWFCHPLTRFPITIINYNLQEPVISILYPYAEYSPEVIGIQWAHQHNIQCRFMDLPTGTFLYDAYQKKIHGLDIGHGSTDTIIYHLKTLDNEDYESLWEHYFEQIDDIQKYHSRTIEFGHKLRTEDENTHIQTGIDQIRESWMKRNILNAIEEGFPADKIVCVCGAYHVKGLQECEPISEKAAAELPTMPFESTLMPYSYERLSMQSGYGAGNESPAYYDMLYHALQNHTLDDFPEEYLVNVARNVKDIKISPAEIIDASKQARQLARLRNRNRPILRDLQDAAISTMGHHPIEALAESMYQVEIGFKTGYLPQEAINTPLQQDFKRQLNKLELESFHSTKPQTLTLDLKEKIHTQDPFKAFIDLYRSNLLHRLRILEIPFGKWSTQDHSQIVPTEVWLLSWSLETEMRLVEASMLGDTIEKAAQSVLSEQASKANHIKEMTQILEDAIYADLPELIDRLLKTLQAISVDASSFTEIAKTAFTLSEIVHFGTIRNFHNDEIIPIIEQLYTRACLIAESACHCNIKSEPEISNAILLIQKIINRMTNLNDSLWTNCLLSIAQSDSVNAKCAGFATTILLENGKIDEQTLSNLITQHLSPGLNADKCAYWFEGLASKNHQSLINNDILWRHLDNFIQSLDREHFLRSLVFLRRTFVQFSYSEKISIIEHLSKIWSFDAKSLHDAIEQNLSSYEQSILDEINQFDFDNI